MLVSMKEVLEIAEKDGTAIGAFNVPNWESAEAIKRAAEATGRPVILNWAPVHSPFMEMEDAAEIMKYFAQKTKTPVAVNLDHGDSFERCIKAIRLGFTSVMIDASALDYDGNVELTKRVVEAAHAVGVSVEAEVGHIFTSVMGIEGHNDKVETADSFCSVEDVYTQPDMARDFKEKTGAGDAFCCGVLYSAYSGGTIADALKLGTACASCSLSEVNGTDGMRKLSDVFALYEKYARLRRSSFNGLLP